VGWAATVCGFGFLFFSFSFFKSKSSQTKNKLQTTIEFKPGFESNNQKKNHAPACMQQ
jgi:hypothetical protein